MSSQLNIKDPRTNALVAELAAMLGRSKTEAVRLAVEAELARERATQADAFERMMAEVRTLQARIREKVPADNDLTDDDLYDANGLPR
jgi:hypothetical protein